MCSIRSKIFNPNHFKQDFIAIGIDKRGYQLKLEKEVKRLHTPEFKTNVPVSKFNTISYKHTTCVYINTLHGRIKGNYEDGKFGG